MGKHMWDKSQKNKKYKEVAVFFHTSIWLVVSNRLKKGSQLGFLFSIHGKNRTIPNQQPAIDSFLVSALKNGSIFFSERCSLRERNGSSR